MYSRSRLSVARETYQPFLHVGKADQLFFGDQLIDLAEAFGAVHGCSSCQDHPMSLRHRKTRGWSLLSILPTNP
jgi:hypothetical protein